MPCQTPIAPTSVESHPNVEERDVRMGHPALSVSLLRHLPHCAVADAAFILGCTVQNAFVQYETTVGIFPAGSSEAVQQRELAVRGHFVHRAQVGRAASRSTAVEISDSVRNYSGQRIYSIRPRDAVQYSLFPVLVQLPHRSQAGSSAGRGRTVEVSVPISERNPEDVASIGRSSGKAVQYGEFPERTPLIEHPVPGLSAFFRDAVDVACGIHHHTCVGRIFSVVRCPRKGMQNYFSAL